MYCHGNNEEGQCCYLSHKQKMIACILGIATAAMVVCSLICIKHHHECCCKKDEGTND